MKDLLIIALAIMLAGCVTPQPKPQPQIVEVQVRVPCVKKAPVKPAYLTGKGDYPGGKAAAQILARDFESAEQYGNEWAAAAAGCLIVPPAKP